MKQRTIAPSFHLSFESSQCGGGWEKCGGDCKKQQFLKLMGQFEMAM